MGCTVQFAPLIVGMSSSSGGFRTPKSAVWNKGVTAQAPVSGGSCKKIQCDICETMFAGGSRRILEHHVKCKSAPVPLKEWALDELAKMEDRHREKDAVKDMESIFGDIKEVRRRPPRRS
jgi:hypothetical protein